MLHWQVYLCCWSLPVQAGHVDDGGVGADVDLVDVKSQMSDLCIGGAADQYYNGGENKEGAARNVERPWSQLASWWLLPFLASLRVDMILPQSNKTTVKGVVGRGSWSVYRISTDDTI
jgi:hypothetical protein